MNPKNRTNTLVEILAEPKDKMTISKALRYELYGLFGPNGSEQIIHINQKQRLAALRQLELLGLIELKADMDGSGFIRTRRTISANRFET